MASSATDADAGSASPKQRRRHRNPDPFPDLGSRVNQGRHLAQSTESLPQKRFFRQRAHCNPLSFNSSFAYPTSPDHADWSTHYPGYAKDGKLYDSKLPLVSGICRPVEFVDVGCGFGGLTVELARLHPESLVMGMEIRYKVTEYVRLRIEALRKNAAASDKAHYQNASVMRTNAMKYLPNYFRKGQLKKMFFCFPDPHFKAKNHRRRIVTTQMLGEYAYLLAPGGLLYTITDVKQLADWMQLHTSQHPCFERVPEESLTDDPVCKAVVECTEEGIKVARNKGSKYLAVYRRVDAATANSRAAAQPFFGGRGESGSGSGSAGGGRRREREGGEDDDDEAGEAKKQRK